MATDELKTLGENVTAARLGLGWSKEKTAREADVSSITLNRVEHGERVRPDTLARILNTLGLAGLDPQLVARLRMASDEQRAEVEALLGGDAKAVVQADRERRKARESSAVNGGVKGTDTATG